MRYRIFYYMYILAEKQAFVNHFWVGFFPPCEEGPGEDKVLGLVVILNPDIRIQGFLDSG